MITQMAYGIQEIELQVPPPLVAAGDVTLITGGGNGIGRALADALSQRGERLLLISRRGAAEAAARELTGSGAVADVLAFDQDLSEPDGPQRVFDYCQENKLHVSTLINNAGFGLAAKFTDQTLPQMEQLVRVNVLALISLTRLFLPGMIARGQGTIVNVSSTAAFGPSPDWAVYGASKAFVQSFTESLQEELVGTGVYVTSVCPGQTLTNFFTTAGTTAPSDHVQTPPEVAAEVLEGMSRHAPLIVTGRYNRIRINAQRLNLRKLLASLKGTLRRVGVRC